MSGEVISLVVSVSWTISALLSEKASIRMGEAVVNVYRMALALALLGLYLFLGDGFFVLQQADSRAWMWLLASGLVGYTFGDYCLYNAYTLIGSRFAQLFMTLASPCAAFAAWLLMGERMSGFAFLGMLLTVGGIAMAVFARGGTDGSRSVGLKLPLHGVVLALGAALGQGVGLVLSKEGMLALPDAGGMTAAAGTVIRGLAGLAGFVVMLFVRRKHTSMGVALSSGNMLLLLALAVFGPAVGVSLSLKAAQLTSVGVAQTIMALSPVLIILPAHFIYHQKITLFEVVGAFVSFIGVALFFV